MRRRQHGHKGVIEYLFKTYRHAAEHEMTMLPFGAHHYLEVMLAAAGNELARQLAFCRLSTDIICAMTEPEAVAMYRRLTGHSSGSITDLMPG